MSGYFDAASTGLGGFLEPGSYKYFGPTGLVSGRAGALVDDASLQITVGSF